MDSFKQIRPDLSDVSPYFPKATELAPGA